MWPIGVNSQFVDHPGAPSDGYHFKSIILQCQRGSESISRWIWTGSYDDSFHVWDELKCKDDKSRAMMVVLVGLELLFLREIKLKA